MDIDETRNLMRRVAEAVPAWLQWRQDVLLAQANLEGERTVEPAARRMTELWRRNLSDVAPADALAVVERLAMGQLSAPPYGELPVWIRREALAAKTRRRGPEPPASFAPEPRYRCVHCQDRGTVTVLDPEFVARVRERFEAMTEADFASDEGGSWWYRLRCWYRSTYGPAKAERAVACLCDAGRSRRERQESLNPKRHPVLRGSLWHRETLAAWYATHDTTEVEFWDVPEVDFA